MQQHFVQPQFHMIPMQPQHGWMAPAMPMQPMMGGLPPGHGQICTQMPPPPGEENPPLPPEPPPDDGSDDVICLTFVRTNFGL